MRRKIVAVPYRTNNMKRIGLTLCLAGSLVVLTTFAPALAGQLKARWECDTRYPTDNDVCIPLVQGDLNCGDISYRRFKVIVGQDPHRFDGDKDGIGCENTKQPCEGNYCGTP